MMMSFRIDKIRKIFLIYLAFFLRAFSFFILARLFTSIFSKDIWGEILLAQTLAIWLTLIVEYGFALSGVRELAINRDDKAKFVEIISDILSAKILLSIVCLVISALVILLYGEKIRPEMVFLSLIIAIVQGFSPVWYFQAIEMLHKFSLYDLLGRILYLLLSFYLVKNTNDFYLVLVLQVVSLLFISGSTMYIMMRSLTGVRISLVRGAKKLVSGFNIASFTLITSLYTSASLIILGFLSSQTVVASYGNADRLIRASIAMLGPINQIMLPKASSKFAEGREHGIGYLKRSSVIYVILSVGFVIFVVLFGDYLVRIIYDGYPESIRYFNYLVILFPLTAVNTVLAYLYLIPNGSDKVVTKTYFFVSFLSLVSMFWLIPRLGGTGMSISVILPEVCAMIIMSYITLRGRREEND